jgi:SAM-dependent methyltransferase
LSGGINPSDSELLEAVCLPGAPSFLNRHVARLQDRAFDAALAHVGGVSGTQVLELGCGNARWSELLNKLGASVTAVDLSEDAISRNRQRLPEIDFVCGDILEVPLNPQAFDLVISVTVIQHLPPHEQIAAFKRIAEALRPGGHALLLENVSDHGRHVWARSHADWIELGRQVGLTLVYVRGYAYDLGFRAATPLRTRLSRRGAAGVDAIAFAPVIAAEPQLDLRTRFRSAILWTLMFLSSITELPASIVLPDRWASHNAFVFENR